MRRWRVTGSGLLQELPAALVVEIKETDKIITEQREKLDKARVCLICLDL